MSLHRPALANSSATELYDAAATECLDRDREGLSGASSDP
jgi:hypothetical protein